MLKYLLIICFLCESLSRVYCILKISPIIEIPQGKLRGLENRKRDYMMYLSVPYATIIERFQNPGPAPQWKGVFNATKKNIFCPQLDDTMTFPIGDEDCLTLNIFTPGQISYKKLLPVMFYIHGGGYMRGSSNELIYNPEPFVRKNVIVVVINYRVGAFGFLCLKIKGASGNAGLKDQVAALQWVNQNIQIFGGDPQSVTIFGSDVGAVSVSHLMLSRQARGLFHRAIIESGTALSPVGFCHDPIERAAIIAAKMGYNTKNPYDLLAIFKNASKSDIIKASIIGPSVDPMKRYIFRPCAEKQIMGGFPFITKPPRQILESGDYNKVPVIIGYNNKEGIMDASLLDEALYKKLNEHFENSLPDNLVFTSAEQKISTAQEVREFYFQDNVIDKSIVNNIINYFSDSLYNYPSITFANYLLRDSIYPVFNYYFQYSSKRNIMKFMNGMKNIKGASHGDEIFYMFEPIGKYSLPKDKKDLMFINKITTMWTNFARFTDPTSIKSSLMPINWQASDNDSLSFLIMDEFFRMETLPNPERIDFWNDKHKNFGLIRCPRYWNETCPTTGP